MPSTRPPPEARFFSRMNCRRLAIRFGRLLRHRSEIAGNIRICRHRGRSAGLIFFIRVPPNPATGSSFRQVIRTCAQNRFLWREARSRLRKFRPINWNRRDHPLKSVRFYRVMSQCRICAGTLRMPCNGSVSRVGSRASRTGREGGRISKGS